MPWYDYECDECAEVFDKRHSMTFEEAVECPICKTHMTHKIILEAPGIWIYWKDARSSSEATPPKYLRPVRNKMRMGAQDFGGV